MKWFISALLLFLIFLPACVLPPVAEPLRLQNVVIETDTLWSGAIQIDGRVEVLRTATLTIAPGSDISFFYRDENRDGLGDGSLIIKGKLIAIGTPQQPIRFRSAKADPQPGDWLEIAADFSKQVHLRYCEIRDSAYALHAHFTSGIVEDCHIHHNIDGCRIGQADFVLRNNLIEQNSGKGINFRNSRMEVYGNLIRDNGAGIFLFENDQPFEITGNNILNNQYQLRLGDFYTEDVALQGNWWGSVDPTKIRSAIYDQRVDAEIGAVTIAPLAAEVIAAGPSEPFADVCR